jgi:membrane associated rhomboid family serine protease
LVAIMTRVLSVAVLTLLTTAVRGYAQADAFPLAVGARVRVHQGAQTQTGTVVSLDSASLVFVAGKADTVAAPRASITAVEVSTGTRTRAGRGALIGLGAGAVTGVVVGAAASGSDDGEFFDADQDEWAVGVGLVGAVVGAGVGAIIGAVTHTDKWAPAVLPSVGFRGYGPNEQRVVIGLRMTL